MGARGVLLVLTSGMVYGGWMPPHQSAADFIRRPLNSQLNACMTNQL
jgi:hypothetical protein